MQCWWIHSKKVDLSTDVDRLLELKKCKYTIMMNDEQFVQMVVKAIVNHPDDVQTTRTVDERGVLITLKVNSEDMGYVIGRQGQTARALRILLKGVGSKANARVNLKIEEPAGGRPPRQGGNQDTSAVEDLGI